MMRHLCIAAMLTVAASGTAWAGSNPFIGEVETFAFQFCPSGWLPLNGQLLPISDNEALFNLIGTTYGGDGVSTFALPLGKPIVTATGQPLLQCISLFGIFPSRS